MKHLLLILIVCMMHPVIGRACSCIQPPPPMEALSMADAVFLGEVVSISPASTDESSTLAYVNEVKLRIMRHWKGVVDQEIIIRTSSSSASCGVSFLVNQRYLVYAFQQDETLWTNLCTRTAHQNQASVDLATLGDGVSFEEKKSRCGGPTNMASIQAILFVVVGACLAYRRRDDARECQKS